MSRLPLLLSLPVAGWLCGTALPASAQAVDYTELSALMGEPVTTSVTGKPQRASEAAASIVIITADDIRRSPARDVVGLVQAYAGIDVARWTAAQSDVSIRGGVQPYNARLLVLVNGQQVYQDHFGLTNWQLLGIQLDDIQQIEVVKGPNSALFGFNAVSGVINIITINPLQTRRIAATAEAGTHGYARASASVAADLGGDFGLRASAGYRRTEELHAISSSRFPPLDGGGPFDPTHYEVSGELYRKLGSRTQLTLSASHASARQQEFIHLLLPGKGFEKFTTTGARLTHDTDWGALTIRAYRNQTDIRTPLDVLGRDLEYHNRIFVGSVDALARLDAANTVRIGLEFRDNSLRDVPGYPGAIKYTVHALSAMWDRDIGEALTATLAGRVDHLRLRKTGTLDQPTIFTMADFRRLFTTLSANGSLRAKLSERTTARAAIGRGVQSPSLFSLGSRLALDIPGVPFPLVSAGDPSIRPAILWSGELGLAHDWNDHGGKLELIGFYNRTHDIIGSPASGTPATLEGASAPFLWQAARNVGSFETWGLEATIEDRIAASRFRWSLNWTWMNAQQAIEGDTGASFQWPIAFDRTTPKHKLKAQISYEGGRFLATMAARYTSATQQLISTPQSTLALVDINPSLAVDAKLAVKLRGRLGLELAGENLGGATGAGLSPIASERRLRAAFSYRY